jgi:hypothetical protein
VVLCRSRPCELPNLFAAIRGFCKELAEQKARRFQVAERGKSTCPIEGAANATIADRNLLLIRGSSMQTVLKCVFSDLIALLSRDDIFENET